MSTARAARDGASHATDPAAKPQLTPRDQVSERDSQRVLVDRLWPRGLSKERAHLDEWCKDVAPSTGLRQWYGHNPGRFEEFARRYRAELDEPERAAAYSQLRELAAHGPLTLLTAAKRSDISEAASWPAR